MKLISTILLLLCIINSTTASQSLLVQYRLKTMRVLHLLLTITSCLVFVNLARAQMNQSIQSGRPGQSIGSGTVGYGTFQVQSGIDFLQTQSTNKTDTYLSSNVLRLGLTQNFEMSAVINYQRDQIKGANSLDRTGLSSLQIGFRSKILPKAKGLIPSLAIQTRFQLDSISRDYRSEHIAPIILIAMGHNLSQDLSLTTNLGASYNGSIAAPNYLWTSSLGYSYNDKTGFFIELYGNIREDYGSIFLDTGFDYLINNDLKFDFSAGWGNNRGTTETFISAGISWRTAFLQPKKF